MKIRPLHDFVIVQRDPPSEKLGSIIIPENAQEKLTRGTVIGAGRGKVSPTGRFIETTVKEGDRVVFGKYSGTEIEHHGAPDCVCMTEDNILGILEDE